MINSYNVQFQGKFEIEEALDEEKFALVLGEFDFVKKISTPTGEGSDDLTYVLSPTRVEVKQGDQRLFGKPKRRGSQRLRGAIWHEFQKINNPTIEFEDWYDQKINKLILQLEEVLNFLGK